VNKIFEGLDTVVPMSRPNGDRSVMNGDSGHPVGRNAAQTITADGKTRTMVIPSLALEMTPEARQELTRLTHTLFLGSGGSRVVVFSGVEAGAGCSWTLVRVAELLANADAGTVCVVDANLGAPKLHTYLGASNRFGLSDALASSRPICDYVQQFSGGLHLLGSGSMAARAESMLGSSAFRLRMDELRASFDFVLFDTPPLAASYDALVVASRSDGLAMVVEANTTNRDTAFKAAKDATLANVRMLGVVLNKRTYPIPDTLYRKL